MTPEQIADALAEQISKARHSMWLAREWLPHNPDIHLKMIHLAYGRAIAVYQISQALGMLEIADDADKILKE